MPIIEKYYGKQKLDKKGIIIEEPFQWDYNFDEKRYITEEDFLNQSLNIGLKNYIEPGQKVSYYFNHLLSKDIISQISKYTNKKISKLSDSLGLSIGQLIR